MSAPIKTQGTPTSLTHAIEKGLAEGGTALTTAPRVRDFLSQRFCAAVIMAHMAKNPEAEAMMKALFDEICEGVPAPSIPKREALKGAV